MQVNSAEALTAIELCQTLKLDMTNTMDLTTTGQLLKDLGQINQLKP
jgi:hypothetical protein